MRSRGQTCTFLNRPFAAHRGVLLVRDGSVSRPDGGGVPGDTTTWRSGSAPTLGVWIVNDHSQMLGKNRPAHGLGGYDTPIRGLYQSGAGTHPSGGVTGWNGRLAAQHALRKDAALRVSR
jgi:hypothetical protein